MSQGYPYKFSFYAPYNAVLTEEQCNYIYYETNSVVAYNKILLICTD